MNEKIVVGRRSGGERGDLPLASFPTGSDDLDAFVTWPRELSMAVVLLVAWLPDYLCMSKCGSLSLDASCDSVQGQWTTVGLCQ